jgi:hypothetical protein
VGRDGRDPTGDPFLLALVRSGFGLLLACEAWLATRQLAALGPLAGHFHDPWLPEALVPSLAIHFLLLGGLWAAALAALTGVAARPALLVGAAILAYLMLCDRLNFHHYRHAMVIFCLLLAFSPCDRRRSTRPCAGERQAPLWAQQAIKLQVSFMYLVSGATKLLDPDWRHGLVMAGVLGRLVRETAAGNFLAVLDPGIVARAVILLELALAVGLWGRTRRLTLWVGLLFHLTILLLTSVALFTAEMLLAYLLFVTPDVRARVLRYPPGRATLARAVHGLDWLRRLSLEPDPRSPLTLVERDGTPLRGRHALAGLAATLPALFLLWPLFVLLAAIPLGRAHRADAAVRDPAQP